MNRPHPTRRLIAGTAGLSAVLVLAGCSAPGESTPTGGTTASFSLMYSVANTAESPYAVMAETYMTENPGVSIELNAQPFDRYGETLRTQLQGGNASDVVQTTPGRGQPQSAVALGEAGLLLPLGESTDPGDALYGVDGQLYGQPVDLSATGMLYAASTADKHGLAAPSDADELIAGCAAASASGGSFFALAGAVPSNTGLMALSISATRVYADDPDWDAQRAAGDVTFAETPGWADTLQQVLDLNAAGCFQPGAEGGGFDAITNGLAQGTSVAAFIPGSNDLAASMPDAQLQVRAFPPAAGEKEFLFVSPISTLSITAKTDQPEAAKAFLAWLAEPEQSQRFAELAGTLPASGVQGVDLSGTMYEPIEGLLNDGDYIALPRASWPNAQVYEALSQGTQGLLTGQRTVDDVLKALDEAWDQ
ncbi:ABC transporter substrate-binding protein [Herbiconiux sp. UC225_62]|uniref:ABC transporter substrate-binding protein n=1 Tax=Herbiconiux sp. UC225_62 TaxID=3350168 RepID=UPI0036D2D08C